MSTPSFFLGCFVVVVETEPDKRGDDQCRFYLFLVWGSHLALSLASISLCLIELRCFLLFSASSACVCVLYVKAQIIHMFSCPSGIFIRSIVREQYTCIDTLPQSAHLRFLPPSLPPSGIPYSLSLPFISFSNLILPASLFDSSHCNAPSLPPPLLPLPFAQSLSLTS